MHCIPIASLDDPRLAPYRQLKQSNLTRWSGQFIAEGKLVVERLLASRFRTESLLLSDRKLDLLPKLPPEGDLPVFVVTEDQARELTGFNFHAGVMACGLREEPDTIERFIPSCVDEGSSPPSRPASAAGQGDDGASVQVLTHPGSPDEGGQTAAHGRAQLLVACPRMTDPDNLGSLIRLCRAFGVAGLLLGEGCCDPFSRRTLRVSMGNAFALPTVESTDLRRDLTRLRTDAGYHLSATVLDSSATPLHAAARLPRDVLLLGNETHGLSSDWVEFCDRQLTIPMHGGTDSLNVSVAAGIFLHWLAQPAVPE
ncbi:MAG: TrmH family RNA methyltransferase [Planctomycetaceae bacterium]